MKRCSKYWVKKVFDNTERYFKEQKQRPKGISGKNVFLKHFRILRKTFVPESSFKVAGCFKKETLA